MSEFKELLKHLTEGPVDAPAPQAPPERRTAPQPTRRRRENPLKPKPGKHPKPKAEDEGSKGVSIDVELFKKARESKVSLSK